MQGYERYRLNPLLIPFAPISLGQYGVRMAIDIEAFRKEVYEVVASIPSGCVLSYGQVAWLVGCPPTCSFGGEDASWRI